MKKACFIIPYFGKLPETMPVYLRTCGENPDFDWLIVTDDHTDYGYPANVKCQYTTFDAFVQRVQACFDFPISLKKPYKICDFRAAFGVIFQEELAGYRFWGHCDLDQYFGKIHHFITDDILADYDKILCLGHFTLYRNIERINRMYLISDRKWGQSYRDAFSQERHWIFDEWPSENTSISRIMKQEHVKTYYRHDAFCDLVPFVSLFQRYIFDHEKEDWEKEKIDNTVFVWTDGILNCCHKDHEGNIIQREMLYVHIRQRKMDVSQYDAAKRAIQIFPNQIRSCDEIDKRMVERLLRMVKIRGVFHPDELQRKAVYLGGYVRGAKRRIKSMLK